MTTLPDYSLQDVRSLLAAMESEVQAFEAACPSVAPHAEPSLDSPWEYPAVAPITTADSAGEDSLSFYTRADVDRYLAALESQLRCRDSRRVVITVDGRILARPLQPAERHLPMPPRAEDVRPPIALVAESLRRHAPPRVLLNPSIRGEAVAA